MPIFGAHGRFTGYCGIGRDITKNTVDQPIGEARGASTTQASMLMNAIGEPESDTETGLFCGQQELFKLSPIIK